jgi:hypothetical protein
VTIEELVALAHRRSLAPGPTDGGAPAWTLGCFKRRSITFFSGQADTTTQVYWLQTRGLTADLRLPAGRPNAGDPGAVEGGLARSRWDGQRMTWSDWTSFQLHDRWPEPGVLRRVGECLIEHAPSGAYVEDWRYQPSPSGPLLGLRLVEEREVGAGQVRHRGGGLVVCGQHAAFVRGRARALPAGRTLAEVLRAADGDPSIIRDAFAFEASYARRDASGGFTVVASTDPTRKGAPLLSLAGFEVLPSQGGVVQRVREDGRDLERHFTLDTAEPDFEFRLETVAAPEAYTWLAEEAEALLRR